MNECTGDLLSTLHSKKNLSNQGLSVVSWNTAGCAKPEKYFKLSNILKCYLKLAWEPGAAQVSHNYSCPLPALGRFYREAKYSL